MLGACTNANSHFSNAAGSGGGGAGDAGTGGAGGSAGNPGADGAGSFDGDTGVAPDTGVTPDAMSPQVNGLRGEYFGDMILQRSLFTRIDQQVNFGWVHASPDPRVPVDEFSVRWTGELSPRYSALYTLYVTADDGCRLWLNGTPLLDKWSGVSGQEQRVQIQLVAGQRYPIQIEYFDRVLTATMRFSWSSPSEPKEPVPYSRLFTH